MLHLRRCAIDTAAFPTRDCYPFNQPLIQQFDGLDFTTPVTFLLGENGSGKSTLLEALTRRCGIHIWQGIRRVRYQPNKFERRLHQYMQIEWGDGPVPGSFFGAEVFQNFAECLDEWARNDPAQLDYFGGQSLMTQSHGQKLMAYFTSRYKLRGLYMMDEPETGLSPETLLELVRLLKQMGEAGHAQFIIATHSPILLACPGARILRLEGDALVETPYEETSHYRLYRAFLEAPQAWIAGEKSWESADA